MSEKKPSRPRNRRGQDRKGGEGKHSSANNVLGGAAEYGSHSGGSNGQKQSLRPAGQISTRASHAPARRREPKGQQRLKIVVRHLPPTLPEDIFKASVDRYVQMKHIEYWAYEPGKQPEQKSKAPRASRAYIKFRKADDMTTFIKTFKGHVFVNSEGQEFVTQVELAPYAKVPKSNASSPKDPLMGTLADDPEFLAFLNPPAPTHNAAAEDAAGAQEPKITPLIEFLRAQKAKNDAKQKVKKASQKAKQQEERRKAAQEKANASTEKIKAQLATQAVSDGAQAKKATRPSNKNELEAGSSTASNGAASSGRKQVAVIPSTNDKKLSAGASQAGAKPKKTVELRDGTKDVQPSKAQANGTSSTSSQSKAPRRTRPAKKQGDSVKAPKAINIMNGPTPAEMAAAHAKART